MNLTRENLLRKLKFKGDELTIVIGAPNGYRWNCTARANDILFRKIERLFKPKTRNRKG